MEMPANPSKEEALMMPFELGFGPLFNVEWLLDAIERNELDSAWA